jgi:O-antigen ligase
MLLALKSLFVLLFLGWVSFKLVEMYLFETSADRRMIAEHAKTNAVVLALAFLSFNFWIYLVLSTSWFYWRRKEHPLVPAYLAALFCLPTFTYNVTGFGPIGHFIDINSHYFLSWLVAYLVYQHQNQKSAKHPRAKSRALDIFVIGWVFIPTLLYGWTLSVTEAARQLFYPLCNYWVPYYIVSRGLNTETERAWAIKVFITVCIFASITGAFEAAKGWLLFSDVTTSLGVSHAFGNYLVREGAGILRAQFSTGQPIVLGMLTSVGFLLALNVGVCGRYARVILLSILGLGVLSSVSRGPWVCLVLGIATWVLAPPLSGRRIAQALGAALLATTALMISPLGGKIIDVLPWVGQTDTFNVDYRERLITVSMIVFWENPIFGWPNFRQSALMQTLIQGEGIIDMVNTYLGAALSYGIVGASVYVGIFLTAGWYTFSTCRTKNAPQAQTLLAAIVFCAACVGTVANITHVPLIWLMVAALTPPFLQPSNARAIRT